MPDTIVNYDGSISMTARQVVRPHSVAEIQSILRDAGVIILSSLFAAARRRLWNHTGAHGAHFIDQFIADDDLRNAVQDNTMDIRKDRAALLSYSHDGEVFSIDPIHASTDDAKWHHFLERFNDFAFERHGIPLLTQSPFVERKHVEAAYGDRWAEFSSWIRSADPTGRMLNPFFAALLSSE
jgi:FAD/FMN-containing dehydrogenase